MAKTKKLKYKQADGTLSDYIAIGADASNVDLAEGITLEDLNVKLVRVENSTLKDAQGNIINPTTKVEAIVNDNGDTLEDLLNTNIIQYEVMPEPSAEFEDRIIQYVGENVTRPSYFYQGYFYKCHYVYTIDANTGEAGYEYSWSPIEVQMTEHWNFDEEPTEGSYNPVTSDGIKTYVDNHIPEVDLSNYYTKTETNELLANVDLSNYYTKTEINTMIGDIESLLAAL